MKKTILTALFLLVTVGIFAQNYANKQFALINYNLKITKEIREDLKPLNSYIESAQVHNKEAKDRLKALIVHHLYYNMTPMLEDSLQISILPINSFMQAVKYDPFGYPKASISKAMREGDSPYYFKVEIKLDSKTQERREKNPDLAEEVTFPRYDIDITVYNNEGILPVDRWHGEHQADKPLKVEQALFGSFTERGQDDTGRVTLATLHRKAVKDLINGHLNE